MVCNKEQEQQLVKSSREIGNSGIRMCIVCLIKVDLKYLGQVHREACIGMLLILS